MGTLEKGVTLYQDAGLLECGDPSLLMKPVNDGRGSRPRRARYQAELSRKESKGPLEIQSCRARRFSQHDDGIPEFVVGCARRRSRVRGTAVTLCPEPGHSR